MSGITLLDAVQQAKQRLTDTTDTQASDSPRLDAEILLSHVLQKDRSYLYTWPEKVLTPQQFSAFEALVSQRQTGHPIAHLTGQKEFWGLPLKVTSATLIPRPDTETLVEVALEKLQLTPHAKVLDLGTGSGAIICALKAEMPIIQAIAVDYQTAALDVAMFNAQNLNLDIQFHQSNWFSAVAGQTFDLIVSNPPYIEELDPHLAQGDVRFEPITALTAGASGLDDIKTIINGAKDHINHQAWLILEHGYTQSDVVVALLKMAGFQNIQTANDYADNARVTYGQWLSSKG